ncbi:Scr1 family TA system antitoxin-like transcriptional regulator [Actinomadura bangladeshensis]|uniref:Helix-turn-helix domain-containing protein n=1 Tax=Actinomadura bangladeshensis TaxID=453573 RepID=A0A6L9QYI7_9ACTN|nr:helix-turn-helix domain-containing protein [Actinomadura bangladeshensis]
MTSPFVRRRRLATELRTLREQSGMTADELAGRIYRSRMTVSKLENARCRPDVRDIVKIMKILGVTGEKFDEILKIACDASDRGWWDAYGDAMGARQRMYADLESGAATIRGYNQMSIPGLVQTPEFLQALIDLDLAEGAEINYVPARTIQARLQRQETFFRTHGPVAEIILDEFVLKRLAVPAETMAMQLRHMVDVVSRQPRFTLLVLPLDARLSPGRLPPSTYMIYTFPDPVDQPMVVAENANTDLIHTIPEEVAKYERLHDRLREATLPALESLSLLAGTADRLSEQAGHDT